jgi:Xaa-Pro dipeptidase
MLHMPALSTAEHERRNGLLQELMVGEHLDALVLAANDYRGHKGTLRWIADYNLAHRYGYAVVLPDERPTLVLPVNLTMNPPGREDVPVRFERRVADGLVSEIQRRANVQRIGVVGLKQVMKVEDHQALLAAFPAAEIVDADLAFERVRAVKSSEELAGVVEATRIAERCFDRLLEVAGPGVTERTLGAEAARVALAEGGEDLLFLTMYGEPQGDGRVAGRFGQPADRPMRPGEIQIFSFEIVGPLGYWMEFSRMVSLRAPSELHRRINAAVQAGMDAGAAALRPGVDPATAQQAVLEAVERHGARSAYWSGHGIGQDVLEEPWIGLDVVDDRPTADLAVAESMTFALHPYVIDADDRAIGYMSDTFVVGPDATSAVSSYSRDIWSLA